LTALDASFFIGGADLLYYVDLMDNRQEKELQDTNEK